MVSVDETRREITLSKKRDSFDKEEKNWIYFLKSEISNQIKERRKKKTRGW